MPLPSSALAATTADEHDDARSFFPLPSVVEAVGTTCASYSRTIPGGAPTSNYSAKAHQHNENAQKTSCQWRRMAGSLLTW